jgi:hypothetical protein
MAGASKRRVKAKRQVGQVAPDNNPGPELSLATLPLATPGPDNQLSGGFDGPSDDRSTQERPTHGFGPSLGYDPARGNPGDMSVVPSRLELPSSAYQSVS